MTANLLAEMMKLKNHVRSFPLVDYKISISSSDINIYENNDNYRMYQKQHYSKKTRQTDISEFFKWNIIIIIQILLLLLYNIFE